MIVRDFFDWLSYTVNVVVFSGWIVTRISRFGKRRTVSRFFQSHNVTVYLPLRLHQGSRMVIANEDFAAALELTSFLRRHKVESNFKEIPPAGAFEFDAGSVVICGPKSSEAVKRLYSSDPHFSLEERQGMWKIHEHATNNFLESPMDRTPSEEKDIAYIGRRRNARGETFLLVGGVHAAGSLGAIRYIANYANIRRLLAETKDAPFSAVISAGFRPDKAEIIHAEMLLSIRRHV